MRAAKRKRAPRSVYLLLDSSGEVASSYETWRDAAEDAVGPRFRDGYRVIRYARVPGSVKGRAR